MKRHGNTRVKSGAKELKKDLNSTGLTFVPFNQQECRSRVIIKLVQERCNDTQGRNIMDKMSTKISSACIET
jgi:hypothetical protein